MYKIGMIQSKIGNGAIHINNGNSRWLASRTEVALWQALCKLLQGNTMPQGAGSYLPIEEYLVLLSFSYLKFFIFLCEQMY